MVAVANNRDMGGKDYSGSSTQNNPFIPRASGNSTTPEVPDPSSVGMNLYYNYEAPAPRDYYAETAGTLQAQVDLAPEVFKAESKFRPLYAGLDYRIYDRFLPKYLQTGIETAPLVAQQAQILNSAQRQADIADVMNLGPQALKAMKTANPEQAALLDEMTRQAMDELKLNGLLSPDEERAVIQNTRAAFADRGMDLSNPAMFAEAMNLDGATRARQDRARSFAGDVLGFQKSVYGDPYSLILGRPSSNLAFAQGSSGIPQSAQVGPQLFNPESQYASQLYSDNYAGALQGAQIQAGLDQDYFNTVYNTMASANIAGANNAAAIKAGRMAQNGAIIGGGLGALGSLGAASILACWVAREVYGVSDPRWMRFRTWLLTKASPALRTWYLIAGERFAGWLRGRDNLKAALLATMNQKIMEV